MQAMENGNNGGGGFHVHVYSPGNNIAQSMTVTYNGPVYHGQGQQSKRNYSDEEIAQALTNIVGKTKAIDSKQKWAGAHWLLRWVCNFPAKPQDFCDRVALLPLPDDLEFKCDYNNIRSLSTLSFMNEDPRRIEDVKYSKNDEQAFFMLKPVVVALMEELQKMTI
jgi:hypothetical protein